MSAIEMFVGALLVFWWLLSAINQVRPVSHLLAKFDPLGLLPRWTFFAPNPGIHDNHLVYTSLENPSTPHSANNDVLSLWHSCESLDSTHIPLLWNPQRRLSKTVADINNCLITMSRDLGISERVMPLTAEYLAATNYVSARVPDASHFRWALARSHGFAGNRTFLLSFLSHIHRTNNGV